MSTVPQVGEQLPGRTIHVDRATLVRYAGAGGDFNQIHWDEATATAVGLPNVIAHGMWTMGAAVQVVVDWLGDAGRVSDYSVRFSAPVPVPHDGGADVQVEASVKSVDEQAGTATIALTATVGGTAVLSRALATVTLA
ncbi:MaoC/PaaZ C-terminal domain-containing protein [Allobranchiibius sp. GilTou38]|uniref:MaoC/PaaZ C-terminal domain-containing protein n=1 Tax=Allobranchiibius sp. GilTou38 TaxID=2815210 RepID=UPI001AA0EE55|nr:MaoC/PaaZ C-terminal domain-containing protein [Allobranchiibius sp. GilTou38]MBO1767791.1 MaoC family dehydratase N-terminal domain-containing protein [Allobranchiibius sp. GilTou38]